MSDITGAGLTGVAQALTALRDQDPAFNTAFRVDFYPLGRLVPA